MPLTPNNLPFAPPLDVVPFDANAAFGTNGAAQTLTNSGYFGAPAQIDVGPGRVKGLWALDITALDQTTGDESYTFHLLGSNDVAWGNGNVEILQSQNFGGASGRSIATIVGASPVAPSAAGVAGTAPYGSLSAFPFGNMKMRIAYRYLRLYAVLSGTTPSITANSWLAVG
jgi:hypothetical protein